MMSDCQECISSFKSLPIYLLSKPILNTLTASNSLSYSGLFRMKLHIILLTVLSIFNDLVADCLDLIGLIKSRRKLF